MITAETLVKLTTMTDEALTLVLRSSGYKDCYFSDAKFVGISNGGQFCYKVIYDDNGEERLGKVFLTYNHQTEAISADF